MGKYLDLLATFEARETRDKSDKSDKSNTYARQKCDQGCDQSQAPQNGNDLSSPYVATSVAANPLNFNLCRFGRFGRTLSELERHCPDLVELSRWQQAVEDGQRFLAQWGEQAEALGWTARDLFGLHEVPTKPHAIYRRLGRYDCTGLIWLLQGCPVVALTQATAAIKMPTRHHHQVSQTQIVHGGRRFPRKGGRVMRTRQQLHTKIPGRHRPGLLSGAETMDNRNSDRTPDGTPKVLTEVKQAARVHTETAIETLVAVMNNESAPTAAREAAARAILRRQDMMWTDALRVAVMRAGEDGRLLLKRIAEKRERRGTHSAPKTVTTLRSRQM